MGEEPDRWPPELIVAAARRVWILVEGQTEETFVDRTLAPHLRQFGVEATPIQLTTKRMASGRKFRGGVGSWAQIRGELRKLSGDSSAQFVTSLLDYYGLPDDVPGVSNRPGADAYANVRHVEAAMTSALDDPRIRVHLQLHEFEAMLFCDPELCGSTLRNKELTRAMARALRENGAPELVNDSPQTAPSRRIRQAHPGFRKTSDGPILAGRIGLPTIRRGCPHFDEWLTFVESLGGG